MVLDIFKVGKEVSGLKRLCCCLILCLVLLALVGCADTEESDAITDVQAVSENKNLAWTDLVTELDSWLETEDNMAYEYYAQSEQEGTCFRVADLQCVELSDLMKEKIKTLDAESTVRWVFLRSFDAGMTWEGNVLQVKDSASRPYISFANSQAGMIVWGYGEHTIIQVTENGGDTWTEMSIPEAGESWHQIVLCMTAVDEETYLVGYRYFGEEPNGPVYRTIDCGKTWEKVEMPETVFADAKVRYVEPIELFVKQDKVFCRMQAALDENDKMEYFLVSSDAGVTWKVDNTLEAE